MKIYTAAAWIWRDHARGLARAITESGHEVTSRWLREDCATEEQGARQDLEDIDRADMLVLLTMPKGTMFSSGGRMVEFGYAMAKGKVVAIIGERENVFCLLPSVLQFDRVAGFIAALQDMEVAHAL
jgi:nucleoside 2-deoxyribosyltransferase